MDEEPVPARGTPLQAWTPEAARLADVADLIGQVLSVVGGGTPYRAERPVTARDAIKERKRVDQIRSIEERLTPT